MNTIRIFLIVQLFVIPMITFGAEDLRTCSELVQEIQKKSTTPKQALELAALIRERRQKIETQYSFAACGSNRMSELRGLFTTNKKLQSSFYLLEEQRLKCSAAFDSFQATASDGDGDAGADQMARAEYCGFVRMPDLKDVATLNSECADSVRLFEAMVKRVGLKQNGYSKLTAACILAPPLPKKDSQAACPPDEAAKPTLPVQLSLVKDALDKDLKKPQPPKEQKGGKGKGAHGSGGAPGKPLQLTEEQLAKAIAEQEKILTVKLDVVVPLKVDKAALIEKTKKLKAETARQEEQNKKDLALLKIQRANAASLEKGMLSDAQKKYIAKARVRGAKEIAKEVAPQVMSSFETRKLPKNIALLFAEAELSADPTKTSAQKDAALKKFLTTWYKLENKYRARLAAKPNLSPEEKLKLVSTWLNQDGLKRYYRDRRNIQDCFDSSLPKDEQGCNCDGETRTIESMVAALEIVPGGNNRISAVHYPKHVEAKLWSPDEHKTTSLLTGIQEKNPQGAVFDQSVTLYRLAQTLNSKAVDGIDPQKLLLFAPMGSGKAKHTGDALNQPKEGKEQFALNGLDLAGFGIDLSGMDNPESVPLRSRIGTPDFAALARKRRSGNYVVMSDGDIAAADAKDEGDDGGDNTDGLKSEASIRDTMSEAAKLTTFDQQGAMDRLRVLGQDPTYRKVAAELHLGQLKEIVGDESIPSGEEVEYAAELERQMQAIESGSGFVHGPAAPYTEYKPTRDVGGDYWVQQIWPFSRTYSDQLFAPWEFGITGPKASARSVRALLKYARSFDFAQTLILNNKNFKIAEGLIAKRQNELAMELDPNNVMRVYKDPPHRNAPKPERVAELMQKQLRQYALDKSVFNFNALYQKAVEVPNAEQVMQEKKELPDNGKIPKDEDENGADPVSHTANANVPEGAFFRKGFGIDPQGSTKVDVESSESLNRYVDADVYARVMKEIATDSSASTTANMKKVAAANWDSDLVETLVVSSKINQEVADWFLGAGQKEILSMRDSAEARSYSAPDGTKTTRDLAKLSSKLLANGAGSNQLKASVIEKYGSIQSYIRKVATELVQNDEE